MLKPLQQLMTLFKKLKQQWSEAAVESAQNAIDSFANLSQAVEAIDSFANLSQAVEEIYTAYQTYKGAPTQANEDAIVNAAKTALTNGNDMSALTGITADDVTATMDAIEYIQADKLGLEKEGELYTTHASIALARFANPGGLEKVGENLYVSSANTGEATYLSPADVGAGKLVSGSLEMSNVDLSEEFTEMIVAQRGFQANTRIITTSDEILQELVNLKR